MYSLSRFLPAILLMFVTVGCVPGTGRLGPSGEAKGTLNHVVIVWLYDRGDEHARSEMFLAAQKMEHIPGVVSVVAGQVLSSDRPKVDNSYDLAFVMTFRDEADLRHFQENPTFLSLKKDVLDRYTKDVKVYDFIAE
jgi:hypothetical protein